MQSEIFIFIYTRIIISLFFCDYFFLKLKKSKKKLKNFFYNLKKNILLLTVVLINLTVILLRCFFFVSYHLYFLIWDNNRTLFNNLLCHTGGFFEQCGFSILFFGPKVCIFKNKKKTCIIFLLCFFKYEIKKSWRTLTFVDLPIRKFHKTTVFSSYNIKVVKFNCKIFFYFQFGRYFFEKMVLKLLINFLLGFLNKTTSN